MSLLNSFKNILIIAAHPDDEVLGCGGTMARFVEEGAKVSVLLLGEGPTARQSELKEEAQKESYSSALNAAKILGINDIRFLALPDNRFDTLPLLDIIQKIEAVIDELKPDAVFTHHAGDLNKDHRITHEAVMTATRPLPNSAIKLVCAFEVLSSTEYVAPYTLPSFTPSLYVDISCFLGKKHEALTKYDSEMREFPHPRSYEAVKHLAALRGAHCGVCAAEAFIVYRCIL